MIEIESIRSDLYNLIDEIKKTKEYIDLLDSYNNIMNDNETKKLVDDFNKKKEIHNLYKTIDNAKALSIAKTKLYKSSLYIKYNEKLKIYNEMISKIEEKINDAIYKKELKEVLKMGE